MSLNAQGDKTSLKQIIQSMQESSVGIEQFTVNSTSPVELQSVGDEKLIIHDESVICADEFKDRWYDAEVDGKSARIHVKGIKNGDKLYCLSLNSGKVYVIIGRAGDE